jgi:hypothetical protein
MKLYSIHLFLILIGSLLLCSFLGGSMFEGMITNTRTTSSRIESGTYIGPAGDTVRVYKNQNTAITPPDAPNNNIAIPDTSDNYSGYVPTPPSEVPASKIAPGDEDLYILKSRIVSPVCPVAPSMSSCPVPEPPQPCPACARCPEPAFDCKKVPNYSSGNGNGTYLPRPVLTDFSSFGM